MGGLVPDLKPIVEAMNNMANGLHRMAEAQEKANEIALNESGVKQ